MAAAWVAKAVAVVAAGKLEEHEGEHEHEHEGGKDGRKGMVVRGMVAAGRHRCGCYGGDDGASRLSDL